MNVWRSGIRLWSRARSRTSSSDGSMISSLSAATLKEDLFRVAQRAAAPVEQHRQVVEHVGRLVVDAVVGLLARRARDLLGLLHDLLADPRRVVEQLDGVGALGPLRRAVAQRALQAGQRLVRGRRLELAVVKARPFARVAGRAGGLDERQQRVAVAVEAEGTDALDVAR